MFGIQREKEMLKTVFQMREAEGRLQRKAVYMLTQQNESGMGYK